MNDDNNRDPDFDPNFLAQLKDPFYKTGGKNNVTGYEDPNLVLRWSLARQRGRTPNSSQRQMPMPITSYSISRYLLKIAFWVIFALVGLPTIIHLLMYSKWGR